MSYTYAQLKTAIEDFTENQESSFLDAIPSFIRAAEERILKMVQLSLFRRNQVAQFTTGVEYLGLPSDYLAPFSLSASHQVQLVAGGPLVSVKTFLDFKDVTYVQDYTGGTVGSLNLPKFYAQFDIKNMIVSPTPDQDYVVELHYYYRPSSLTEKEANDTTWLSINAPLCLLYGTLVEAYVFMKGDQDLMAVYNSRFQESIAALKNFGEAKENTDEFRTGMIIRPKQ